MSTKAITKNLEHLGLSGNEVNVYISLTQLGESSVGNIAKKSGLPRTTVKSILERLILKGYISIEKYNNINNYWIESPLALKKRFENKTNLADNLNDLLKDLYHSNSNVASSKVYDTQSSVRNFIEKTVICLKKDTTILTIETPECKNYERFFSREYLGNLFLLKKKRKIITKTLIPYNQFKYIPEYNLGKQEIIIREMNEKIQFNTSFWIIEDRLILFSSSTSFIVEVKNKIIVESFKSILLFIWDISEEIFNNLDKKS